MGGGVPVVSARYSMDLMSSMACASTTFGFCTPGICKGPRAGRGTVLFQLLLIARPAPTLAFLKNKVSGWHDSGWGIARPAPILAF